MTNFFQILIKEGTLTSNFKRLKYSQRFQQWLFRHYIPLELEEVFYDSEPDIDEKLFDMYLEYKENYITGLPSKKIFSYVNKDYTVEELRAAYFKVQKIYKDYYDKRLKINNWIEVYSEGVWNMSQSFVNSVTKNFLQIIRDFPKAKAGRIFYEKEENYLTIYFYGRDVIEYDLLLFFKKKDKI